MLTPTAWCGLLEGSSDEIAAFKRPFADTGFSLTRLPTNALLRRRELKLVPWATHPLLFRCFPWHSQRLREPTRLTLASRAESQSQKIGAVIFSTIALWPASNLEALERPRGAGLQFFLRKTSIETTLGSL
jgi:hypothetical protein